MSYELALNKAWQGLEELSQDKKFSVRLLADEYEIDPGSQKVLSSACNAPAKEFTAILILHYLVQKLKGLPKPLGDWISFKELPGGLGYYDAFRRRSLEPIIRKYGKRPHGLIACLDRLPGKRIQYGDCGIVLDVLEAVPVLITIWGQDEEFSAESNMLFDRTIMQVFCTEDIVVLSGFLANTI